MVGFQDCLGYDYHPDDKTITVNEKEAEIVRYIFDRYAQGAGTTVVANTVFIVDRFIKILDNTSLHKYYYHWNILRRCKMIKWKTIIKVPFVYVIWMVFELALAIVIACIMDTEKISSLFVLSGDMMQDIWGHQLTITSVATTVFLFFMEKANDRRLGMSYKYIFYHEKIFGNGNVMCITMANAFHLIVNFFIAYLMIGIECLWFQRLIRGIFIICLITNFVFLTRLMKLFLIARYKESLIYVQIRKNTYRKGMITICKSDLDHEVVKVIDEKLEKIQWDKGLKIKYNISHDIAKKINKNIQLDCKLVMNNTEYDSYFGDAILTLFALYFTSPSNYKGLLNGIAARIVQRNASVSGEKWDINDRDNLIKRLQLRCAEEIACKQDVAVIYNIKKLENEYYNELKAAVEEFEKKNERKENIYNVSVVSNN